LFEEKACANILVVTDGPEHSMKAADYAVSLEDTYNPKLITGHVSGIGGAIVNYAEKEKVGLIVISTRSRLGINKASDRKCCI